MLNSMKTHFRLLAEGYEARGFAKGFIPFLELGSWAYQGVTQTTRGLYEKKVFARKRLPFPVVSVGNLTWGGTGKTPLVEYLARKVSDRHRTPLILTRGYSHDEVEQMRHHIPRAILGVGKNRLQVAKKLGKKNPVNVAILDDGLQHWPVERDIEIIVINALNPFGNGKLIPRGILREPLSALKRASIVVLTHVNLIPQKDLESLKGKIREIHPEVFLVEAYLEPLFFYRADRRKRVSLQRLQNQKATTFSGVGAPRSFQLLLSRCKIKPIRNFEFNDHHDYTDAELSEIQRISKAADTDEIITTEKDFFRSPKKITKILNPLILATRLRILSGEEVLTNRLFHLLGVTR